MYIQKTQLINFGSSNLNIASIADNHGDILGIPQVIKTLQDKQSDIFEKKDEKSTKNVFAIAGDYFMNPSKKGILTDPKSSFGDIQYSFLLKLLYETQRLMEQRGNFSTVYTPGNHCYGGGDHWLYDKLFLAPLSTLLTNIDPEKSPILDKVIKRNHNIRAERVIEIPDSKNPNKKNHALFLGITIPSMYYLPKGLKNTIFYDQTQKNDPLITENDLKETIRVLNSRIEEFKKKHPKGVVILLSHTGNRISNILAQNVPDINIILNAHDHKDYSTLINKTLILSHGQNNAFIRGTNIHFDDEGNISIKAEKYHTSPYIEIARNDTSLDKFTKKILEKDLDPLLCLEGEALESRDLLFSTEIRYKNTILANLITTALRTAAKQHYPQIDAVGIPSTIIRSGLKSNERRTTFNNIDLFNMFKGVDECVSGISIGEVTGENLIKLILENVRNNLNSPTRNALIQWSDIQINRTAIANNIATKNKAILKKFIKIRNQQTGEFEAIKPDKKYCILMADKYLIKNSKTIKIPAKIRDDFKSIPENYNDLFKEYISIVDRKIQLTKEIKETRIL